MPDLRDLDHFDEGLPAMNPLPAAEIRRRGDQMRRRRTALVAAGGVLAVAVAVAAPVLAMSGSDPDRRHDIQPAPRPTQTDPPRTEPPNGWLTEVLDFPIETGFPTPFKRSERFDADLTPGCERTAFAGSSYVTEAVVSYTGESEDRAQRWLLLYPGSQEAQTAMRQAREDIQKCLDADVMSPAGFLVYDETPVNLGTEESYAWTEQVQHDGGLFSDLTYVQAARTGNAIYVESSYGAAGGDDVIAAVQQLLTERSAEPLGLMCVYAADPCLDPYAPVPTGPGATGGTGPQSVTRSP